MTIGTAFSILSAILGIAKWWLAWMERKKYIEQGAKEAVLAGLRAGDEAISKANKAREDVRSDLARNPDNVRAPDEFTRKDS